MRHRRALDVPARPARPDRGRPTTARPASGPSRARSRGRRPWRTRRPRRARRPASAPGRGGRACRTPATRRSGRRPSHRRSGRRGRSRGASRSSATIVVDVLGRPRQDVRPRHPERGRVGQEALAPAVGQLADADARGGRAADDLVVDVGDVHHPRDAQAAVAQVADEDVGEEEGPEVADVGRAVDRRAAAVDPDVAGLERLERPGLAGHRVLESDRHPTGPTTATAWAETVRPAPSSPPRLPVEAFTLTEAASTRSSAAIAARIASRWPASRGRAPMIVTSRRRGSRPASRESGDDGRDELAAGDPARRRRTGREQPPQIAHPCRAEQRIGDGMERDVAVGVAMQARRPVDRDAAEHERPARPERMAVGPVADAIAAGSRRGAAGASDDGLLDPREIRGYGHLEVGRFAGENMNGNSTGLEQRGLVGPGLGSARRETLERRSEERGSGALRRLGRGQAGPVDGLDDHVAGDTLERLGDRQHRDRGPVRPRPPGRPPRRAPAWVPAGRRRGRG